MEEVCQTCGLPDELCLCDEPDEDSSTSITVTTETRGHGNDATILSGVTEEATQVIGEALGNSDATCRADLASHLKKKFSCGGSVDEDEIMLQGNHKSELVPLLTDEEGVEVTAS